MQVVCESVLWKYHQLKDEGFTVKVRMTNFRNVEYISTNLSCKAQHWDLENKEPLPSHPDYRNLCSKIKEIKEDIDFELKFAKKQGEVITIKELKTRVEKKPEKTVIATPKKRVLEFYDEIIEELEKQGRTGYADVFKANKGIISNHLFHYRDKHFLELKQEDFLGLENHIRTLKTESTKSNYLRTFYSLWNLAIKRGICPKEHHPRNCISFQPYKRIKTRKRAISEVYIKKIEQLNHDYGSRLFRSQRYFLFSYYCRGMNFTDMAKLRHEEHVSNGHINYKRSKNKRHYSFELHPKAWKIVQIFKKYPMQSGDNYVFPILDLHHDTPRKIAARIDSALKDFNEDLLEFEKQIGCPKHLTSYVSRHSFATNLRKNKVDISIIKEAMGHETEFQTNTYLEEIDDSLVAQAIKNALK
ncbi:tyrosine-type recombinase/integrase [Agriterribacter sp.]|uniref:tyrosine-type recombinase/integrase n=1 Tax=Agriterribacter sp. TaxID=2821509 RepID=UPI002CE1CA20|nr:tyrosine-type recombinase/integrase [Agriterribacter sp.]HRO45863.1 tyrosine-type recombinase/integrase [Agriterribacter sp.]